MMGEEHGVWKGGGGWGGGAPGLNSTLLAECHDQPAVNCHVVLQLLRQMEIQSCELQTGVKIHQV